MDPVVPISAETISIPARHSRSEKLGERSFKETLVEFLEDVNSIQREADKAAKELVTGEASDIHQVMIRAEEAQIAFSLLLEIRNKVIEAYHEIMRMQV